MAHPQRAAVEHSRRQRRDKEGKFSKRKEPSGVNMSSASRDIEGYPKH